MKKTYGPILQSSLNAERSILGGLNVDKYPEHQYRHYPVFNTYMPLLGVEEASQSIWKRNCCRWRKNSNVFAIEFIAEGEFRYTQNGKSYIVGANSLFLVKHFATNEMVCLSSYAKKLAVLLYGSMLSAFQYLPPYLTLDYLKLQSPDGIRELMERLITPDISTTEAAGLGMELLLKIEQEAYSSDLPDTIRRITEYIDEHLGEPLETKDLCQMFNISEATLNRHFMNSIKQTPRQYIIGHRMETARQLLLGSSLSIKAIAAQLGYCDQLYFSSDFKNRIGMSPTDFRRKHTI